MPSDQARSTVDIMMYADLRGIESHGLLIASLARSIGASNADLSNAAA